MSLPFGHISRIIYNIWLFNFLFPYFFFLLDCVVDSDNELYILSFHHRGRRRLKSSFRHHCGTLTVSSSSQIISKSTLVKKKKCGSRAQFSSNVHFSHANRNAATTGKRCHPRQRRVASAARTWKINLKKKKPTQQTVTVFKGPKGINKRNAAFIFFSFLRGELGVKKMDGCYRFLFLFTDGWDVM